MLSQPCHGGCTKNPLTEDGDVGELDPLELSEG